MSLIRPYILFTSLLLSFAAPATTHVVTIVGNSFSPASLTIEAGDTVRWVNNGGFHNVQADDGSFRCADSCEVTAGDGNGDPSSTWTTLSITFNNVGDFAYFCAVHGGPGGVGMAGTIQVVEPTSVAVHLVTANADLTFSPNNLNILAGDVVHFHNDGGFHNVRADDDRFECSEGCLNSGRNLSSEPLTSAWNAYVRFETPGLVPYYCEAHGNVGGVGMAGLVDVVSDVLFASGFE